MGGFTSLPIAEDAGRGPVKLERCATANCSGRLQLLFDGFTWAAKNAVLARADFGGGDSSPIAQVYLFLFDGPMDGRLRISETLNLGGTRLEVDFVGGLAPAPEPTTLLLCGTTAAGLGLLGWRRRRAHPPPAQRAHNPAIEMLALAAVRVRIAVGAAAAPGGRGVTHRGSGR
ncbi:MAG: PEP-CTERM sorting domain-containing protein [Candidatus Rokubacteria bacterium]|nr:PEP-CTERM sorting domain-containing protein [Candidatus Rokubacteria bacterium]